MAKNDAFGRDSERNEKPTAEKPEPDPGFEDGLDELPPNVPLGMLGEYGVNLRKPEDYQPRGTSAGMIQEWTRETTMMVVLIAYFLFFPLAYVILWRTTKIERHHKLWLAAMMTAGLIYIGIRLILG